MPRSAAPVSASPGARAPREPVSAGKDAPGTVISPPPVRSPPVTISVPVADALAAQKLLAVAPEAAREGRRVSL